MNRYLDDVVENSHDAVGDEAVLLAELDSARVELFRSQHLEQILL